MSFDEFLAEFSAQLSARLVENVERLKVCGNCAHRDNWWNCSELESAGVYSDDIQDMKTYDQCELVPSRWKPYWEAGDEVNDCE